MESSPIRTVDKRFMELPHVLDIDPVDQLEPKMELNITPSSLEHNKMTTRVLKHHIEEVSNIIVALIKRRNLDMKIYTHLTTKTMHLRLNLKNEVPLHKMS
nr:hypothetical protein Itr_chr11CG16040 [Ipomoea trifida]